MTAAIERLGPHNIEAEEAVLGSILINPEALTAVSSFLEPTMFFELKHVWIFQGMLDLRTRGDAIDNMTVVSALRDTGKLEDTGGAAYITYLINSTPTHIYVETYGHIVERCAVRRRILGAAGEIAQLARERVAELDDVVAECNAALNKATHRAQERQTMTLADAASGYFDRVEKVAADPDGNALGYPTGLYSLDQYLTRLERGGLYLVAARPKVGKTTLLLNIARNLAKRGARVQFFSMEMSRDEISEKFVSAEAKIPSNILRSGKLTGADWDAFVAALSAFNSWPLFLEDTPSLSPAALRRAAIRQQGGFGLDAICVDYIQLMQTDHKDKRKQANRNEEVASISQALKQLARELNVPVLAACQINRAGIGEPELHHLRDSGALEADANGVLLLWEDKTTPNGLNVKIAAHRNGPTGSTQLYYNKPLHNIACMSK